MRYSRTRVSRDANFVHNRRKLCKRYRCSLDHFKFKTMKYRKETLWKQWTYCLRWQCTVKCYRICEEVLHCVQQRKRQLLFIANWAGSVCAMNITDPLQRRLSSTKLWQIGKKEDKYSEGGGGMRKRENDFSSENTIFTRWNCISNSDQNTLSPVISVHVLITLPTNQEQFRLRPLPGQQLPCVYRPKKIPLLLTSK